MNNIKHICRLIEGDEVTWDLQPWAQNSSAQTNFIHLHFHITWYFNKLKIELLLQIKKKTRNFMALALAYDCLRIGSWAHWMSCVLSFDSWAWSKQQTKIWSWQHHGKKNNRGLYEYVLHLHAFHFSFFCAVEVVANISVTEQV